MRTILELKPLYSEEKNGKTRIWKAEIRYDADLKIAYAIIEFGQDGGKMQITTREYQQGKNIGKKNETSALEQCTQETQRKWKDKKEKEGYSEEISKKNEDIYYPMLAQTYDPSKSAVTYPCFVQPKLDGLRCVVYTNADKQIVFQSRTGGRFYTMDHMAKSVESCNLIQAPSPVLYKRILFAILRTCIQRRPACSRAAKVHSAPPAGIWLRQATDGRTN